ncbi:MAG TPA: hypothetical protein PKC12_02490 [Thiobacillaceae bacterium]|nr:hypothetical protein [Thiobacillaceae bacterium]
MPSRFRRLLLLLLMLVLPLQTFASATMLACAFPPPPAPHHAMADGGHGCHENHDGDNAERATSSHDCRHCATCVLASALPIPSAGSVTVPLSAADPAPRLATAYVGFIPDGPERPPRPILV